MGSSCVRWFWGVPAVSGIAVSGDAAVVSGAAFVIAVVSGAASLDPVVPGTALPVFGALPDAFVVSPALSSSFLPFSYLSFLMVSCRKGNVNLPFLLPVIGSVFFGI